MAKKVGIVTFHRALNYGAVLQAYALQQFLAKNGIENEIIDYISPAIEEHYKPFHVVKGNYIRAIARGFLCSGIIYKKKKRFLAFRDKYLCISPSYHNIEELRECNSIYKYFVAGSDQVWSPECVDFDENYFLTFSVSQKKFSYAASIGAKKIPDSMEQEYYNRLHDFQAISLREEEACSILQKSISVEPKVHLDPTLLLNEENWSMITGEKPHSLPYLLLFNVEKPIEDIEFAKKIAHERGLDIIYINDRTVVKDKEIHYVVAPSPEEFVTYFKYASCVVTNSFHGTAFSVIFHKDVFVELENLKKRNVRSEALLAMLGIEGRDISEIAKLDKNRPINWDKADAVITSKRLESINYFREIEAREV